MSTSKQAWLKSKGGKWQSQRLIRNMSARSSLGDDKDVEFPRVLTEARRATVNHLVPSNRRTSLSKRFSKTLSKLASNRESGESTSNPMFSTEQDEALGEEEVVETTREDPTNNGHIIPYKPLGIRLSVLNVIKQLTRKLPPPGQQQNESEPTNSDWSTSQVWEHVLQPLIAGSGNSVNGILSMYKTNDSESPSNNSSTTEQAPSERSKRHSLLRANSADVGVANVFVIHAWNSAFSKLVQCLEDFISDSDGKYDNDNSFFWIDVFSLSYQTLKESKDQLAVEVYNVIPSTDSVVCVLDAWKAPGPLQDRWCLWQLACTRLHGKSCTILADEEQLSSFEEALMIDLTTVKVAFLRPDYSAATTSLSSNKDVLDESIATLVDGESVAIDTAVSECFTFCFIDYAREMYRELEEDGNNDSLNDRILLMQNVSNLYARIGSLNEACDWGKKALEANRKVYGNTSQQVLSGANALALLYSRLGQKLESLVLFTEVLETSKNQLGTMHPDTLTAKSNLGMLYKSLGSVDRSLPLLKESLAGRRKVLGDSHPKTVSSMNNLASLFHTQAQYAEAKQLCEEALQHRREQLGDDHPSTLNSINNLGALHDSMGYMETAKVLYTEAYERACRVFGKSDPRTLVFLQNLTTLQDFTIT